MKFSLSSEKKTEHVSQDIPTDIRRAVSIMGGAATKSGRTSEESDMSPREAAPRKTSPFLSNEPQSADTSAPSEIAPTSPIPVWNPPAVPELKPLFDDNLKLDKPSQKWILWLVGAIILLILLGAASYWHFFLKTDSATAPLVEIEVQSPEPEAVVAVTLEPPYSVTAPNYLSFDVETITLAGFRGLLKQSSERILNASMTKPVEFLLTDKNNNPIAFNRFSYLMELDVQSDFLAMLDERFSLYLYNEAGKISFGLGLSLIDTKTIEDLLRVQRESLLPLAFQNILYEGVVVPRENTFRSGLYNGQAVRYVNIDAAQNISFDYAVRGNVWFIGTSKETLRAILDK